MSGNRPFSLTNDGVRLAVRLSPRASRNAVTGIVSDADGRPMLAIRLTAPPVEGAANSALIAFLASTLGLRKADVSIHSGETGRTKLIDLAGDGPAIAARLTKLFNDKSE